MSTEEKAKQSTILRGICSSIQAMAFPTFDNLREILAKFGYELVKKP